MLPITQKTHSNTAPYLRPQMLSPLQPSLPPFLYEQKVLPCMKLWEHLLFFLLLLFFLFVGVGGSAQGDVVLKIRSQIRVSSCSFGVRRRRVFFLLLVSSSPPTQNFFPQTQKVQIGLRVVLLTRLAHAFGALLVREKPRRFVTFNPCKPCPHIVFCSVCRSTSLHHPPPHVQTHISQQHLFLHQCSSLRFSNQQRRAFPEHGGTSSAVGTGCSVALLAFFPWLNFNLLSHAPPPPSL